LLGIKEADQNSIEYNEDIEEVSLLCKTLGLQIVENCQHNLRKIYPATYISKQKASEIINKAKELHCDNIVINAEITPGQMKNLQDIAGYDIRILDRTGIIIDIFSVHAKTGEAKTQVSLAKLEYMLPRLTRQWTHLERQMGGTGTRGGPGEKQIEIDRRLIRKDIDKLKKDLIRIQKSRRTQNKHRSSAFQISLVGYTNAGKSSLMNVLTDSDVYVKNELFATLDSTTKKLKLNVNKASVISDTVGFIQKLPHELVASFRSTLSDIQDSDLILKVVDSSYSNIDMHILTIEDTIKSIECDKIETRFVFNKIDLITAERLKALMKRFPGSIFTSAFRRIGHENLISNISDLASTDFIKRTIKIKYSDLSIIDYIYKSLDVYVRKDTSRYVEISAKGPKSIFKKIDRLIKT
tara:strand:+ start:71696 stop:72925 length:1230 start_codon:yes stop_codon:yes gene_type:complete